MNKQQASTTKFLGNRKRSSFARTKTQFPGIGAAADRLGVSRFHLWEVLKGRRQSQRLSDRYHSLKRGAK